MFAALGHVVLWLVVADVADHYSQSHCVRSGHSRSRRRSSCTRCNHQYADVELFSLGAESRVAYQPVAFVLHPAVVHFVVEELSTYGIVFLLRIQRGADGAITSI